MEKHYTHRIHATLVYPTDRQLPFFVVNAALIIAVIVTVMPLVVNGNACGEGPCLRENRLGCPSAMYEN